MTVVPPLSDRPGDLSDLRQFGVALTRDDRLVPDHASAAALVDRLFRQAALETVSPDVRDDKDRGARDDARVRAFGQFVRLHRRHVRRLALDDGEFGWDDNGENAHGKASAGRRNEVSTFVTGSTRVSGTASAHARLVCTVWLTAA